MDEKRLANKLVDIFSDDRLNAVALANYTQYMFTRRAERRMNDWLAWHNKFKHEEDDLSEFD